MTERPELIQPALKAGDTCEFIVGDKTLILEPIPYGRLKKVLKVVMESMGEIAKGKDMSPEEAGRAVPELLMEKAALITPMLFDAKKHPYMNGEWLENNLTIPLAKEIFKKAVVINDLSDFFAKMGSPLAAAPKEVQLSEASKVTQPI